MIWGEEKRLCLLYALTPIHAGSGQALKAVDLPIQRERHTAWPMVQASGIKGALRDWCEKVWAKNGFDQDLVECIFGKSGEETNWSGAVTVTDARLLLFPVRSNVAPFVHVTCPAVLKRFREDLSLLGQRLEVSVKVGGENFIPLKGNFPNEIILEDMVVNKVNQDTPASGESLKPYLDQMEKAVVLSDEVFGFLVRTATEVQAHITIDDATGTARDGSLRYQEYLPADSVLYFLAFFADERSGKKKFKAAFEVANLVTKAVSTHLQIGGDFTLGKGICKVKWISSNISAGGSNEN